jgi:hypothetical protein
MSVVYMMWNKQPKAVTVVADGSGDDSAGIKLSKRAGIY